MRGQSIVQNYLGLAWLLPALILQLPSPVAHAQVQMIDTTRASASFWIRPVWLKRIEGVFPVLEGTATRRPDGGLLVDVAIDARALQMQRASYLTWAQSAEFFDVEQYPWIRFQADPISSWRLHEGGPIAGWLQLRDARARITFDLEPAACVAPGIDCPVRASADIRRSAFGMDARRLALGDVVHLSISVYVVASDGERVEP